MQKKIHEILKDVPLFNNLDISEITEMVDVMDVINVEEGEMLIREGELSSKFFIILSGHFLVYFKDGASFILKNKGDFIGWSTLVMRSKYTASARALTKGELIFMKGSRFLRIMKERPEIIKKIINNCKELVKRRECKSPKEWQKK